MTQRTLLIIGVIIQLVQVVFIRTKTGVNIHNYLVL